MPALPARTGESCRPSIQNTSQPTYSAQPSPPLQGERSGVLQQDALCHPYRGGACQYRENRSPQRPVEQAQRDGEQGGAEAQPDYFVCAGQRCVRKPADQINRDGKAGDNGEAAQAQALQQFRGKQRNQKWGQYGLYGRGVSSACNVISCECLANALVYHRQLPNL